MSAMVLMLEDGFDGDTLFLKGERADVRPSLAMIWLSVGVARSIPADDVIAANEAEATAIAAEHESLVAQAQVAVDAPAAADVNVMMLQNRDDGTATIYKGDVVALAPDLAATWIDAGVAVAADLPGIADANIIVSDAPDTAAVAPTDPAPVA